ncbi:MAG: non-ribosomal peptide synthetase, partial [bacterium]|nr:non-ribosomal peptide synthetase [bacterium]
AKHEEIKEAIILAIELSSGIQLCAYYISQKEIVVSELRSYMEKHLPPYMIPSYFIWLEKFPETATGKVDRKALPDPATGATGDIYEAPHTGNEKIMADVWQNVLGIEQIGIENDFFELGGDSIKAMQILSGLQKKQLKLEMKDLFAHRTIKKLATKLKPLTFTGQILQGPVE